jgi:hypothetical protein
VSEGGPAAGQPGVTTQGAGRWLHLGSPAAALVLGGLILVLAVAAVPLARLAHQSLNADNGQLPVWVDLAEVSRLGPGMAR